MLNDFIAKYDDVALFIEQVPMIDSEQELRNGCGRKS
jgi:hypothetical protein